MGISKNTLVSVILRISIVLCLAAFFLSSAAVGLLQGTFMNTGVTAVSSTDGVSDMRGLLSKGGIFSLNGTWEYYPQTYEVNECFDTRDLDGRPSKHVLFPLNDITSSRGPGTYRLILQTDQSIAGYAFYLENYSEDFAIYVNGSRVHSIGGIAPKKMLYSLSDYMFRIDAPVDPGTVEIIISANSSRAQSLLYRNPLILGHADDIADYNARIWRDDTFLIGIIMVIVTIGLVFVLFRTRFDMLTSIALFDTFLAIRILLGYNVATYFIHDFFPVPLSSVAFTGLQYVAFFLAGAFGCLLSQSIFDPKRHLSTVPVKIQMSVCSAGGLFTFFFFGTFPSVCIALLFVILVGSFIIVTWHVCFILREKKLNTYYFFQIIKTYYVGVIMVLDILNLQGNSYNALVYAYVLFLFADLAARIMDNYSSYKEVEMLNHNLEEMIEARTGQLTEINRCLSELSIRDPLTQAHNRLFFEKTMENLLQNNKGDSLYLCMFDLDHFKSINDRYGHIAGDEQLKFVVSTVNKILGDKGTLSRVGGEEFVILFSGESKDNVLALLEQIRRQLSQDAKANKKRTTASFGLVGCKAGDSSKDVLRAADKCLYCAKKMGRNCIILK